MRPLHAYPNLNIFKSLQTHFTNEVIKTEFRETPQEQSCFVLSDSKDCFEVKARFGLVLQNKLIPCRNLCRFLTACSSASLPRDIWVQFNISSCLVYFSWDFMLIALCVLTFSEVFSYNVACTTKCKNFYEVWPLFLESILLFIWTKVKLGLVLGHPLEVLSCIAQLTHEYCESNKSANCILYDCDASSCISICFH